MFSIPIWMWIVGGLLWLTVMGILAHIAFAVMPLVYESNGVSIFSNMSSSVEGSRISFPDGSWVDLGAAPRIIAYKARRIRGKIAVGYLEEDLVYLSWGLNDHTF